MVQMQWKAQARFQGVHSGCTVTNWQLGSHCSVQRQIYGVSSTVNAFICRWSSGFCHSSPHLSYPQPFNQHFWEQIMSDCAFLSAITPQWAALVISLLALIIL